MQVVGDKSTTTSATKKDNNSRRGSKILALPGTNTGLGSTRFPQDMRCLHDHGWHPGFSIAEARKTGFSQRIPCAQKRKMWQQQWPSSSARRKTTRQSHIYYDKMAIMACHDDVMYVTAIYVGKDHLCSRRFWRKITPLCIVHLVCKKTFPPPIFGASSLSGHRFPKHIRSVDMIQTAKLDDNFEVHLSNA